ncbi:unnamed protein product [Absidia cylindrospora]
MVAGQNRKMNYSTGSLNTNCGATKATPREFFETMNGLCLPRPIAQGIYYTPSTATEEAAADCTRTPVAPQRVMTSTSSPPMRSSFPSPVSFECTIHSLPDFNVSATPTLSPPTPVTDDFGLPLQPPLNSSGIDQNPDPSAQPAQLPQQQQYIDEKIIRSQFQAKHGEQIGIISPSPVTNNNVDLLQKNILRLEKLEKAIQYLVTYGLSCDELLEWLDDPRSYHEVYEQSLMKCVKAVYINSPNFGPWTGLKVLETIQKNGRYMSAGARGEKETDKHKAE